MTCLSAQQWDHLIARVGEAARVLTANAAGRPAEPPTPQQRAVLAHALADIQTAVARLEPTPHNPQP